MKRFRFRSQVTAVSAAPPDVVHRVISDLRNHLVWSGDRATDPTFKLTSLDAPDATTTVGTAFSSTGANFNGTFHDRSVVTDVDPPRVFVIETDARLERRRGRTWEVHFVHRYDVAPEGAGSKITYTETITQVNYVPYWLRIWARPLARLIINSGDRKQLANLARLAEERMHA